MTVLIETVPVIEFVGEGVGVGGGLLATNIRRTRQTVSRLIFDRRYGVETAEFADLEQFGLAHAERVYYSPANWGTLRRTLPAHEVTPQDVFLDLGSGKARMVLEAASRYPFRRAIGVELSSELTEVARQNLRSTRLRIRAGEVELVQSDVLDYRIPDDVTVVFLNNPFRGEVFATAMRNLIASVDRNPRPVTLVYFNPVEEPFLLSTGRIRHLRTVTRGRAAADDIFGTTRIYRITMP
ncbi:class I SAM-dependent methyltransferase [Acrocarpospora catenulata]|uniref:class I SAM-dependent methyltransferase n=1 Tax=Acrocarpospora catenulata TaxID=2836182 RepID=UPI0027E12663|nr:class I SAM-dependent methyltransferase [Acrocarpospora catenulata]